MTRLGDVSDMLVGFAFKSAGFLDADADGVRILRGDNVQQGHIRWADKTKKWPTAHCNELERYQLAEDDLILAMDRPIVGDGLKMAWIMSEDLPALLVQRVCRLRGKPDVALTNFIRYVLAAPDFSDHIHRITTGANIPHISGKDIAAYEFELPDLEVQGQIVECLSAYDDLITTNQRRITLLEDAARRLYREWFVHLRFPAHESVPVKDGLPEGWSVCNLFDVCEVDYGFPFKANQFNTDGIGMPAIRIRDIPDVATSTYTAEEVDSSYIVKRGDFLIGMDGIFHMNFWVGEDALLVQRVCRIRPKNDLHRAYVGLALHAPIKAFEATIQGATVAHLGAKHLKSIELLIPAALDEQLDYLNQALSQQIQLRDMNRKLAQARALLIPKLMSGQLDVSGIALPDEVAA